VTAAEVTVAVVSVTAVAVKSVSTTAAVADTATRQSVRVWSSDLNDHWV